MPNQNQFFIMIIMIIWWSHLVPPHILFSVHPINREENYRKHLIVFNTIHLLRTDLSSR